MTIPTGKMHRLFALGLVQSLAITLVFLIWGNVFGQAQTGRRPIRSQSLSENPTQDLRAVDSVPDSLIYVMQRIDLRQELGADDVVFSLDGEPVSTLYSTSVTLGLLINAEGYIVTRLAHIPKTEASSQIKVYFNTARGSQIDAKFIGMDSVTGLCVLQMDRKDTSIPLKVSSFAASNPATALRQIELYGIHPSQFLGRPGFIVVRPRIYSTAVSVRKALDDFRFSETSPFYQVTARTPLTAVQDCSLGIDKDGTVVGLFAFDTSGEGQHLLYPMARIRQLVTLIIQDRTLAKRNVVPHAWLGATGNPIQTGKNSNDEIRGIQIAAIFPDSPADLAGIRPSDILMSIGGRILTTGRDLRDTLQMLPADSSVTLKVRRNKEFKTLQAKLVPSPVAEPKQQINWIVSQVESYEQNARAMAADDPKREEIERKKNTMVGIMNQLVNTSPPEIHLRVRYGIEVIATTAQLAKYFSAPGGVLITRLNQFGKASQAGLKVGDVIVKIGEIPVGDVASFLQLLNESGSEQIEVFVIRSGQPIQIRLPK